MLVWAWDRLRIRTRQDAPYTSCCFPHWTHCTDLLTVWSLWGNPGMARCRRKGALTFGYIQKPKALLASSSGIRVSMRGTAGGTTGQVASTLRIFFFFFFRRHLFSLFWPTFSIPHPFPSFFFVSIYHHMNVTRKITYIEELTGMVNAEGKRNLEKFKHHFL